MRIRNWTEEHHEVLRQRYATTSVTELMQILPFSRSAIKTRIRVLGLSGKGFWTTKKVAYLKKNYSTMRTKELATALGTTPSAVTQKAYKLKIKADQRHKVINETAFKKGRKPYNEGRKMPPATPAQKATQFQKGQTPHNLKKNACVMFRFDRYDRPILFLKIEAGKWVSYARWVFEQWYGAVPDGKVITHRNGNRLDCRLENLECISRRESYLRNSPSINLSDKWVSATMSKDAAVRDTLLNEKPEIIELKRNLIILKRQLK